MKRIAHGSRRQFLQTLSAGLGAAGAFPRLTWGGSPNSLVQVASVGVNGMGLTDLSNIGSHPKVRLVAFCDVDRQQFEKADAKFRGVPHFSDYRQMLEQLGDRCDAVQVSTPDHMHAPITMAALRRGKHVFCQKPLTHTVWEARQVRQQAERGARITQMGNQIHSAVEYRLAVRLVREGVLGRIREVHSWIGVHGRQHAGRTERPPAARVPETLDWNLWIGAAPMRPFGADVYHPFKWRDWQDFGSGALGDFGCHILDPVFNALGLTAPLSLRAEHAGTNREVWPGPETVQYRFPGTALTAGEFLPVTWYDGGRQPALEGTQLPKDLQLPKSGGGSLFVGEKGTLLLPHVAKPRLYPERQFAKFPFPDEPGFNHWHVWIEAILAGRPTSDGFHYAGPLAETVQLGNIAARWPGQNLEWDAAAGRITNHPSAHAMLTKSYRAGFEVPAAG